MQVTPKNPAKLRKMTHRTRSGTASDDPVMRCVLLCVCVLILLAWLLREGIWVRSCRKLALL